MRRRLFIAILIGNIVLSAMLTKSLLATAQSFNGAEQITAQKIEVSPSEQKRWDEEMIRQSFEQWFAGVKLTPRQKQLAQSENARYYRKFQELGDRVDKEGREIPTEAEAKALEDEFFGRLKSGLSQDQIQQVRENMEK